MGKHSTGTITYGYQSIYGPAVTLKTIVRVDVNETSAPVTHMRHAHETHVAYSRFMWEWEVSEVYPTYSANHGKHCAH